MKIYYLTLDKKKRVCLEPLTDDLPEKFLAYIKDGNIILEPIYERPSHVQKDQAWLFEPENREILARLQESLQQEATIDLGSFQEYLETDLEDVR